MESTETVQSAARPGVTIVLNRIGLGARNRIILEVAALRSKHRGLMLDWKSAGGEVTEAGATRIPEAVTDDAKRSKLFDISEQMTIVSEELAIETAKRVVKEIS